MFHPRPVFSGIFTLTCLFMTLPPSCAAQNTARALIYSATADFRHDSIPTAIEALKDQGPTHNVTFDQTEDQTVFTDDHLAQYDALVFLMNTGEGEHDALSTLLQCLEKA